MKTLWNKAKIGDVCSLMTGGTPSRNNEAFFGGNIKWLVSGDIHQKEIFDCEGRITESGLNNSSARLLPINSVMIALNGQGKTKGTVALLRTLATCNQSLVSILPNNQKQLLPEFLYANLHGRYQEIRRLTGDDDKDRRGLNMPLIRNIEIPLPPIHEQQRIVAILDEAFDAIAAARANAEQNSQNARALFTSYLQSVFSQPGDGWRDSGNVLSSMCELIVDCEHKTAPTQDEGFPSIRTPNIGKGKLLLDNVKRVSEETYLAWTRRAVPLPGDLIFAREAPAGNVAVVPDGLQPCLGQRTVLIRPKKEAFDSLFLTYLLLSPSMQEHLLSHSKGATVQHINMKDIRALRLGCIPPIREQRELARRITDCSMYFERLESLYQRKIAALDELKQSLLQQAFSGQL
ncbi:restriction endonuclease subunit S [Aeromonas veronii]|uniref:restriction endonuclease subunit S n=1 Tax=Aeromonas veronii TaxID=654 RepID=UPI003BA06A8E